MQSLGSKYYNRHSMIADLTMNKVNGYRIKSLGTRAYLRLQKKSPRQDEGSENLTPARSTPRSPLTGGSDMQGLERDVVWGARAA